MNWQTCSPKRISDLLGISCIATTVAVPKYGQSRPRKAWLTLCQTACAKEYVQRLAEG
jgi:hypothetical protein